MGVRRKQLHSFKYALRLVIVKPTLTGLKAANDRMTGLRCVL